MKIGIIIPVYNEEKVIIKDIMETLKTASSFYDDFEVLIIDDGSKDRTYFLAKSVKDKRVIVRKKPNTGKSGAWKYGFRFASGDFITFIDADLDLHHLLRLTSSITQAALN